MQCKSCNQEIPVGSVVCPYCGQAAGEADASPFKKAGDFAPVDVPIPKPISTPPTPHPVASSRCPNCGAEVKPENKFCPVCGAKISTEETGSSSGSRDISSGRKDEPLLGGYTPPAPAPVPTRCPKCGTSLPEGTKFCQSCGAKVEGLAGPVDISSGRREAFSPVSPVGGGFTVPLATREASKLCASTLSLVAVITYAASLLFNLIGSISGSTGWIGQIRNVLSMMDMDEYMDEVDDMLGAFSGAISGTSVLSAIIGMIPTILIAIGLWMVYLSASGKIGSNAKITGLKITKVIVMIQLVCLCICFGALEIVTVVLVGGLSDFDESVIGIMIGVMLLIAAIGVPIILFYAWSVKTVNTIRTTFSTGKPLDTVSRYVAVICYISGGCTVISSIVGTVMGGGAMTLFQGLCSAAASIAFGMFIFSYRTKMQDIMTGRGTPAASR